MTHAPRRSTASRDKSGEKARTSGDVDPSWFPEQSFDDVRRQINRRRQQYPQPPQIGSEENSDGYRHLIAARRYGSHSSPHWDDANLAQGGKRNIPGSWRQFSVSTTYMIAAAMAVLAGGGAGYAASKYETIKQQLVAFLAPPAATAEPVLVTASNTALVDETVISKKPVAIATLMVADAQGVLNSQIPLALSAEPSVPGQDLILRISGVPKSAYLTAGTREADSDWHLPASAAKDLKLVVTSAPRGDLELAVAAFEPQTGELMSPVKQVTVTLDAPDVKITPASAPPISAQLKPQSPTTGQPSAIPLPDSPTFDVAIIHNILNQAEAKLQSGAFTEARELFESAYNTGSAEGAIGVARTFDPQTQTRSGMSPPDASAKMALEWYNRATTGGSVQEEARAAISRLSVASRGD